MSLPPMLTSTSNPALMRNNGRHVSPQWTFEAVHLDGPAVRIMGIMVNACYTSSLLGTSIHPLLLRRQGKQGDLPNPREAVSVGSLINQAVESQEKTAQLQPCFL